MKIPTDPRGNTCELFLEASGLMVTLRHEPETDQWVTEVWLEDSRMVQLLESELDDFINALQQAKGAMW